MNYFISFSDYLLVIYDYKLIKYYYILNVVFIVFLNMLISLFFYLTERFIKYLQSSKINLRYILVMIVEDNIESIGTYLKVDDIEVFLIENVVSKRVVIVKEMDKIGE